MFLIWLMRVTEFCLILYPPVELQVLCLNILSLWKEWLGWHIYHNELIKLFIFVTMCYLSSGYGMVELMPVRCETTLKYTHLLESNCTEKKQSYHVLNNKWQKVMKQKILLRWFWRTDSKAALQNDMKLPIFIHSGKVHLFVKLKRTPLEK